MSMEPDIAYRKRKVAVMVLHATDGSMHPTEMLWDGGRRFTVEQCGEPTLAKCRHTGGDAVLYPVKVNGQRRDLYRGDRGWFVEVRDALAQPTDPRRESIPE